MSGECGEIRLPDLHLNGTGNQILRPDACGSPLRKGQQLPVHIIRFGQIPVEGFLGADRFVRPRRLNRPGVDAGCPVARPLCKTTEYRFEVPVRSTAQIGDSLNIFPAQPGQRLVADSRNDMNRQRIQNRPRVFRGDVATAPAARRSAPLNCPRSSRSAHEAEVVE